MKEAMMGKQGTSPPPLRDSADQYPVTKAYRMVPVEQVRSDSEYQRAPKPEFVHELVRDWEPLLAGVLVVSVRGGALWLLDGGHRVAAMRELGITHADATVLEGLTQVDEASLFVRFNKNRRNMTTNDLFRALVTARDAGALSIQQEVFSRGLTMGEGQEKDINAVGALMRVESWGGGELVGKVLDLILNNWTTDKHRFIGRVLTALGLFLRRYWQHPQFDMERLDAIMEATSPALLMRKAQEIAAERGNTGELGSTSSAVSEAIRVTYNNRLGAAKQLPHARRIPKDEEEAE